MGRANLTPTRAVAIARPARDVWPWLAQLGQGRAGFYSEDRVENLVGCDIHSADRIVAEWQPVVVGDRVNLHADVSLTTVLAEPGRTLVLRGARPDGLPRDAR